MAVHKLVICQNGSTSPIFLPYIYKVNLCASAYSDNPNGRISRETGLMIRSSPIKRNLGSAHLIDLQSLTQDACRQYTAGISRNSQKDSNLHATAR